jgi:hypothetical protein
VAPLVPIVDDPNFFVEIKPRSRVPHLGGAAARQLGYEVWASDGHAAGPDGGFFVEEEGPMGLGLSTGTNGGEIQPYISYDAKAGRLFRVDRILSSDGTSATDKMEITNTVSMIMDLANIKVGWIHYTSQGPIRRLVVLGQEPIPPRPEDKNAEGKLAFKQGFEVYLLLDKASGGGAPRVLSSTAGCVIEAMDALHDAYLAAPEGKAGKLPIVRVAGVQPVTSGKSMNYKPTFTIVGWIDRPASLVAAPQTTSPKTPPATGSTQVKAPAPQPDPASDFG